MCDEGRELGRGEMLRLKMNGKLDFSSEEREIHSHEQKQAALDLNSLNTFSDWHMSSHLCICLHINITRDHHMQPTTDQRGAPPCPIPITESHSSSPLMIIICLVI